MLFNLWTFIFEGLLAAASEEAETDVLTAQICSINEVFFLKWKKIQVISALCLLQSSVLVMRIWKN